MEKGYAQQYPKNTEHGNGLPQKEKSHPKPEDLRTLSEPCAPKVTVFPNFQL